MILTKEQFERKYGPGSTSKFEDFDSIKPEAPSFISGALASLKGSFEKGKAQIQGTDEFGGSIVPVRGAQLAGTIATAIPNAVMGGISAVTPEPVKETLSKYVAEPIGKSIGWLADLNEETKKKLGLTSAEEFVTNYPQAAKVLEETAKVGAGLAETAGGLLATKGLADAAVGTAKLAKTGVQKAMPVADKAIKKAKDLFTSGESKIGDTILPIPDTVKTTLKRTTDEQLKTYVNQARVATVEPKANTPLELAGEKAKKSLEKIQYKLDAYGRAKSSAIDTVGDKNVGTIGTQFRQKLESSLKGKDFVEGDKALIKKVLESSRKLGNNPTAKQVDGFIDSVQSEIWSGSQNLTIPVTDSTTGMLRKLLGELNSKLKSSLNSKAYNLANEKYSSIIDTRNILNKALGADASKGGALMKRVFSPADAGTKKLFADVKTLTGIDLVDEAVLAKWAMDLFGDARQASILQQLSIPSEKSLIEKALQAAGKTIGVEDWLREAIIKRASKIK